MTLEHRAGRAVEHLDIDDVARRLDRRASLHGDRDDVLFEALQLLEQLVGPLRRDRDGQGSVHVLPSSFRVCGLPRSPAAMFPPPTPGERAQPPHDARRLRGVPSKRCPCMIPPTGARILPTLMPRRRASANASIATNWSIAARSSRTGAASRAINGSSRAWFTRTSPRRDRGGSVSVGRPRGQTVALGHEALTRYVCPPRCGAGEAPQAAILARRGE